MKWSCSKGFFLATTGWDDTEASSALNLQFPLLWKTLGKAERTNTTVSKLQLLYRIHSIHYLSALVWTFAHWPWNWIIFALCNICFGSAYYHELAPDDQLLRVSVGNLWAGPFQRITDLDRLIYNFHFVKNVRNLVIYLWHFQMWNFLRNQN